MSWSKSISLDVANKLFNVVGVYFEQNQLEDGYVAKHKNRTLKRPMLIASCMAVLSDWITIKED